MKHFPGISAVTTCSISGLNTYGRRMMQSWTKNWPVKLTCYTEGGFRPPAGVNSKAIESIAWLQSFLATKTRRGPTTGTQSEYRHDAKRFSFKTAAIIDAAFSMRDKGREYLIWVDADTYTHERVSHDFVEKLLPTRPDEFVSWLNRDKNYPETGFLIFDLQSEFLDDVMLHWQSLYDYETIYELVEWHDAWVFQWLMKQYPHIRPKSISGEGSRTNHPFINGPLGKVMDHMKGQRKAQGRTGRSERKVHDGVAYWRR